MYNGFIVEDSMRNNKLYDGNTYKFGITINRENYIVKTAKDNISSLYSEYIASNFIRLIGVPCQEVYLGYYKKNLVVIIKDFTNKNMTLKSYKSTSQSSEDTDITTKEYTYEDVLDLISKHTKMTDSNKYKAKVRFWDMFIMDAILGNRDRHRGNWGYLKCKNEYLPAPLYDNGASLFPDFDIKAQEYKQSLLNGKEYVFIEQRVEKFPASLFQMKRNDGNLKRTNYYEILSDLRVNKILAQEVKYIRDKIGFNQIYETIFRVVYSIKDFLPEYYARFYIIIVCVRYLHMIERNSIKTSYQIAVRRVNNESRA